MLSRYSITAATADTDQLEAFRRVERYLAEQRDTASKATAMGSRP